MKDIKHGEIKVKEDGAKALIITYSDGTTEERKLPTDKTCKFEIKDKKSRS